MNVGAKIWGSAGVCCLILIASAYAAKPLRIVVSGEKPGIESVFVANDDVIKVLHASAALGTAVYKRFGERWKLVRGFEYSCRDPNDIAARRRFFAREGWFSDVSLKPIRQRVFQLGNKLLGRGTRVAIVHFVFPTSVKIQPASARDGTTNPEVLRGETLELLSFDCELGAGKRDCRAKFLIRTSG
jgi:hypothetical protein